ncbi:MAG: type II toxin-antitoxin system RelE/ParE family toxin [Thiotrichales bacterium]|nr:type II toxin-antitoxin system RelE/ParE family toxin [Thiotrichales bacterium]
MTKTTLSAIECGRQMVKPGLRIFKIRAFSRFAGREGIGDAALCDAMDRARSSSVDADLGGGVIKQRIARKGGGRAGGFRTIVLFRRSDLAFFVYGFSKSDRENLRQDELETFRRLADQYWRSTERVWRRRRRLER